MREDILPTACPKCGAIEFEGGLAGLWDGMEASGICFHAKCLSCKTELVAYDTDEAEEAGESLVWEIDDAEPQ